MGWGWGEGNIRGLDFFGYIINSSLLIGMGVGKIKINENMMVKDFCEIVLSILHIYAHLHRFRQS